jgi:hypothetical protein
MSVPSPGCSPEHRILRLRQVRHLHKPETNHASVIATTWWEGIKRRKLTQHLLFVALFEAVRRWKRSESALEGEDDCRRSSGEKGGSSRASGHPWSQHIGHLSDSEVGILSSQPLLAISLWARSRRNQRSKEDVAWEVSRWQNPTRRTVHGRGWIPRGGR